MNLNNTFIHPTALISPDAEIGESVRIGAYTIVNSGVSIGDDSEVSDFCTLGEGPLRDKASLCIGSGSFVRSHAVVYAGSSFGEKLETGHHVVIRENTHAGENLRVGNFSDIEGDYELQTKNVPRALTLLLPPIFPQS